MVVPLVILKKLFMDLLGIVRCDTRWKYVCLLLFLVSLLSCASYSVDLSNPPDFGLRVFYFPLFPEKQFIVLGEEAKEVDPYYSVASKMLSSFEEEEIEKVLALSFLKLPEEQKRATLRELKEGEPLNLKVHKALVISITDPKSVHQNKVLDVIKNLILIAYGEMSVEEVQVRYYAGLTNLERQLFSMRLQNVKAWIESRQEEARRKYERSLVWQAVLANIASNWLVQRSYYNQTVTNQWQMMQQQQTNWQLMEIQNSLRRGLGY